MISLLKVKRIGHPIEKENVFQCRILLLVIVLTDVTFTFNESVVVQPEVDNERNITVCDQTDRSKCVSFDLSEFAKYIARIDRNQTIIGDVIFNRTLIVDGDIIQQGLIDGVDLLELHSQSVFLSGGNLDELVLNSNITVVIEGDLITETINGVDFTDFVNRTLRIDEDEVGDFASL